MMGMGQSLTEKRGLSGSFFTGCPGHVVASPCTAPAMGTALGAAVLMPWPLGLSIFVRARLRTGTADAVAEFQSRHWPAGCRVRGRGRIPYQAGDERLFRCYLASLLACL